MRDGTREDTTVSVQIEELKRAILALPFVTKLTPVRAHNGHGDGWEVSLRYSDCEEYDNCGKKPESPVQISSRHPTEFAWLQEILQRLQDRHVDCAEALTKKAAADAQTTATVSADTPRVLEAMMLFQQAKKHEQGTQDRAKAALDQMKASKKVALETEKDNDPAQKELQELQWVTSLIIVVRLYAFKNGALLRSALAKTFQLHRKVRWTRWSILTWVLWDGLRTGVLEIVLLLSKSL
jgi:hypothetical protein